MSDLILDEPEKFRFRVDRSVLRDQDIFEREMSTIFDKCWMYLGHESEIPKPGDFKTRDLVGRPLIFSRDRNNKVHAFINACPHRGATVCRERSGKAKFMTCPNHGWTFDMAGELVNVPQMDRFPPNFDKEMFRLPAVAQLESYRGFVFVTFNHNAEPLSSYLGEMTDYLDLIANQAEDDVAGMEIVNGSHEYAAKCNWKLIIENIVDGSHVPIVHQRYLEMMVASGMDFTASTMMKDQYVQVFKRGHMVLQSSAGAWGRPGDEEQDAALQERRRILEHRHGAAYAERLFAGPRAIVIFPNFAIVDLIMGVTLRAIDPIAPDYTTMTGWHIAPKGEATPLRRQRLDNFLTFWGPAGMSTPDDIDVLEAVQRNLGRKPYGEHGPTLWQEVSRGLGHEEQSGQDEYAIRHFWRRWSELVLDRKLFKEDHPIESHLPQVRSRELAGIDG